MDTPKKSPRAGRKKTGNGPGWGGPAKGSNKPAFDGTNPGPGRGHINVDKRARDAERAEALKDLLYNMAFNAEHETNRLNAASKMLDRIEGMPTARQEITGKDGGPLQTQQLDDTRPPIEAMFQGKQEDEEATKH